MNVTSIISALGNNASLTPIIVKDTIDNTGRTIMAYNESAKVSKTIGRHAGRETFIEENVTSVVWAGGIPALKWIYDKVAVDTNKNLGFKKIKGLDDTKSFWGKFKQTVLAKTDAKLFNDKNVQTIEKKIAKFEKYAENSTTKTEILDHAKKIVSNKNLFKNLQAKKAAFSTLIPLAVVGFILPKAIYKLTENSEKEIQKKAIAQQLKQKKANQFYNNPTFKAFVNTNSRKSDVAFTGMGNKVVDVFNSDIANLAILDAGVATGRMATARGKYDALDKGVKEVGVLYFIYLGGSNIAKGLNYLSKKIWKTPIALDNKVLENKEFKQAVIDVVEGNKSQDKVLGFADAKFKGLTLKEQVMSLFGKKNDTKSMNNKKAEQAVVDFIENNLYSKSINKEAGQFDNLTLKMAKELGDIDVVQKALNPFKTVNTKKISSLNKDMIEFVEAAIKSGDAKSFLKKAKNIKRGSVLGNIAICAAATAYVLPKLQFLIREKLTGSPASPGVVKSQQLAAKEVNAMMFN